MQYAPPACRCGVWRGSIARNPAAYAITLRVVPRGNHANSQTVKATLGLRELLLDGVFKPRERVPELRLVEELGVSRTPLRIALMTLEHEGLLETLPGGGFVVREFTRTDIDDAIELRGVLEGTAARLAAERLESEDELEPLRACCRELDAVVHAPSIETFMEYVRLNEAFHSAFRGLAKSPQLGRALEHVLALPFAPPSALLVAVHSALPESWEILLVAQHQHHALVDAIHRREGARADAIAREHARIARQNLDVALENRHLLDRLPGSTLLRLPAAAAS
jgi:GntR family transcriptional regulator of vanillate catabolism